MKFSINFDKAAKNFKENNPQLLKEARKNAVTAAGMAWSDETKSVTREDSHIDTGLYINSIGYVTNFPARNKSGKGQRPATQQDVVYELDEGTDVTTLAIGSNVEYAESLEKRFNLMARGLDRAQPRMEKVSEFQVQKTLFK